MGGAKVPVLRVERAFLK